MLQQEPLGARLEVVAPEPPRRLDARRLASLLGSTVSRLPAKALFTRSAHLRGAVRRALDKRSFDLVLISGADLLWLLDELPAGLPVVVFTLNRESDLLRAQIDEQPAARGPVRGLLLREWRKQCRWEEERMGRVAGAIFVSRSDAARASDRVPRLHVPPVFEGSAPPEPPRPAPSGEIHLGFLANFTWWPNRRGLDWLVRRVLPRVGPHVRVHLFGRGSEGLGRFDPHLVPHGWVDDLTTVWRSCHAMICPVSVGAGVSVKVAESLHHGMPLLAHPFAVRGLDLPSDPAVLLLEDAAAWVHHLRSPQGFALARRTPAPGLRAAFSAATHREAVRRFLLDVIRGTSTRPLAPI